MRGAIYIYIMRGYMAICIYVPQLAEKCTSIPKVVGLIPTVTRHIFQLCPVWKYTQSNITSIIFT